MDGPVKDLGGNSEYVDSNIKKNSNPKGLNWAEGHSRIFSVEKMFYYAYEIEHS